MHVLGIAWPMQEHLDTDWHQLRFHGASITKNNPNTTQMHVCRCRHARSNSFLGRGPEASREGEVKKRGRQCPQQH